MMKKYQALRKKYFVTSDYKEITREKKLIQLIRII